MENNNIKTKQWFLHIDLDAFFASVEQLDHPEYRGKPVIVGGTKEDKRGVVSTASYEARKFGIHSAMPLFQAINLCPQGIFVRGRMDRYAALSYQIMNIFREFSPDVEQMSIDEAFVDLTGTEQLFGPPEETALNVKKRVKELTGLTVSVGLAPTKYLAKIASGYSKPDGFYFIKPGEEQNFMLSLPLKKVWGVGPKALERLKKAGITTTKDIYDKPLDLLNFLFGNNMGTFLYNVVRGEEKEVFTKKRKSHSISAENTFSSDLTDIYTAETALLELAQGVMFRLLKEEKYSRTVTVKIKYDDFTSVSIQKTLDRNIITLDTFFDTIKVLFEQKYETGRGIRLLGVGFDKVENTDKPYQQSLFEEKEDKKQAVEKAILTLNKKHPEIKIQKARLLKSIVLVFMILTQFSPLCIKKHLLYGEENTISVKGAGSLLPTNNSKQSDGAIFNWDINDKNHVKFDISGQWKADIIGSFKAGFGKDTPFTFVPTMPVFKQDIELSSMFTLNNTWYFEGNFADNFSNNTLALGYNGTENNYFRSGRLSNRNITMPNNYSAEFFGFGLSGGNNQAPGISLHWQAPTNRWSGDFLFRYDMTAPKSIVYEGMNQVNNKLISNKDFLYGHSFIFPKTSIPYLSNIQNIYVENSSGKYKDIKGKSYKKLSSSEYFVSKQENKLFLSQSAMGNKKNDIIPTILITFNTDNCTDEIIKNTGNYDNKNSFAGQIQEIFNTSQKKYNLNDFAYNLKSEIENKPALVIQNDVGFSPYLVTNTYHWAQSPHAVAATQPQLSVISNSSGNILKSYIPVINNHNFTSLPEDFFLLSETYSTIVNKNNISSNYPFVENDPEIYLNIETNTKASLKVSTFTPVTSINIGQKASAGTIQVYKNSINIKDFIYDKKTGNITLNSAINNTDQIKIYWQEESTNYDQGALSLALGYKLNILENLNWDIIITAQKPLHFEKKYSTIDNIRASFAALSSGLSYKNGNFIVEDKAVISVQKPNDSDTLLVSTPQDNTAKYYYFEKHDGKNTSSSLRINNNILKQENNITNKDFIGLEDKNIKGYKIPLKWKLDNISTRHYSDDYWASVDLHLRGGKELKNSETLNFQIQIPEPLEENYDIYIQLGIKAGEKDKNDKIQTIKLTDRINFQNRDWQTIKIPLSEEIRASLVSYYDCRFIIIPHTNNLTKQNKIEGTIYIGPYKPVIKSISTTPDENVLINTSSTQISENTFSSQINWTLLNPLDSNRIIKATTYFSPADFSQYKKINLKFALSDLNSKITTNNINKKTPGLKIILDNGNDGPENKTALIIEIDDLTPFISNNLQTEYHNISVDLLTNKINIDGIINDNFKIITINKNVPPSRAIYEINTTQNTKIIKDGSFYVSDINYTETDIIFSGENYLSSSYSKEKILSINNFDLLKNGFISTDSKQKFTKDNVSVISNIKGGISIADIDVSTDLSINQDKIVNAGHILKSNKALLNIATFNEEYRWNLNDKILSKNNNFSLSLSPIFVPIKISSSLSAIDNEIIRQSNHDTNLNYNLILKDISFTLSSSLKTNQNINLLQNIENTFNKENYFDSWYNITKVEFSTGEKYASTRKTSFENSITTNIKNNFITPTLKFNLSSVYENSNGTNFSNKSNLDFSLPIQFNNNNIIFNISKNQQDINNTSFGGNYFSDLEKLFQNQSEYTYIYSAIPFYELFDNYFIKDLKGDYSTKYELIFNRKLSNSFKDLYIPAQTSLTIIRDLKTKDKLSDTYQIKTVITNNSINNFGKQSINQIFKWFEQEEIISSLTGIIKIPTDNLENISFNLTSYIQLLIFLNSNSTLHAAFDYSIETGNNWSTGGTIVYSRPGKTNLILSLIELFWPKIKEKDFNISRKDSLNYKIGTKDCITRQEYIYNHKCDINFLQYFTITTGIGGSFTHLENKGSTISLDYSLGGLVRF